ncbi:ANTAR domain-containing protein [Streptomyces sp. H39-S7]|uniref:ANTAR domain-containing protein n=1 Tax=Streptomyces sp. H39-S7 TaxID=3004357 RepID=UPI0022B04376|nr:ANTAR domain-containing protein [Streptomyces sp. H39-S7]MCZ4117809.1 ANTAR domain-containing protein [Streptomyces sp. H39-S7]
MIGDRMADVLTRLHLGRHGDLAAACATALWVDGVALSLVLDGDGLEPLWSHSAASTLLEDLQFTLGEGPGIDCARTNCTITVPDLHTARPDQWPALRAAITEADLPVGGLFCFPLGLGAIRVGALTLRCSVPGPLLDSQASDASMLAAALTAWYLSGNGSELRPTADVSSSVDLNWAEVHQATGMLSVQLGVPLAQALLRLRAHAYAQGSPLREVAADVVARRLRFTPDPDAPSSDTREG